MKMKDGKINDIEESRLEILKVVGKGIDDQGREVIKGEWKLANGEVSLGSLAKPNKDIMSFRYKIEAEKPPWFKEFFGT